MLRKKESKVMYRNILLTTIMTIVITLLVSSTILYVNFDNIALKQVYASDSDSLQQTSTRIQSITGTAASLSFQIYRDFVISKLLFYDKPDIFDIQGSMAQLNNYRLAMPFIDSIYVYNGASKLFYVSSNNFQSGIQTREQLGDPGMVEILDHFQAYTPFIPIPRTFNTAADQPSLPPQPVGIYSYLCYDAINLENSLNSAIIVNISESFFNKTLQNQPNSRSSNEFIINKEGTLLSTNGSDAIATRYAEKSYIQRILANAGSPGYLVADVDSVKSLISYTAPDPLGWRYIRVTPYAVITEKITSMRTKTIYISLSILLAGLLMSLFTSKRLYDPIDKVIRSLKLLENERRDNQQILRQNFLRNMLTGRDVYHPAALQKKLSYFGSSIDIANPAILLMVKIDRFEETRAAYNDQITLMRYAMMNIGWEVFSPSFHTEAIDMEEDHILLLLSAKEQELCLENIAFTSLLEQLRTSIADYIKLSVSLTISPLQQDAQDCFDLYHQLLEASYHRLFRGHGCMIHSDEILAYQDKEYQFPTQKEKQLVERLMTGDSAGAEAVYSEIIQETAVYPYSVVHLAISHLTLTVNNVLTTMNRNNAVSMPLYLNTSIASLSRIETIAEVDNQFFQVFRQLEQKLDEKKNSKHLELIKKMNDIIERDYANPNLSLQSIADELSMSPVYISRLYKQNTLVPLTDYIQDVRLSKSKELLLQTNLSVADIAEKTGFTSDSYFYRLFKKYHSITPNDFRKKFTPQSALLTNLMDGGIALQKGMEKQ
ncbi:AraC family transcriptional regulator [Paenibacillus oryzisoli]|uniref:AraC family transcriptional regulator n=1 Tax=Paenibacillus oryzisoli TaxID=1850517 RepID=UPI003D297CDF